MDKAKRKLLTDGFCQAPAVLYTGCLSAQRRHPGRQIECLEIPADEGDARVRRRLRPILDLHPREGELHQLRAGVGVHHSFGPFHSAGQPLQELP